MTFPRRGKESRSGRFVATVRTSLFEENDRSIDQGGTARKIQAWNTSSIVWIDVVGPNTFSVSVSRAACRPGSHETHEQHPTLPTPTTQCKFGNRILRNFAGRGGIKFRRDTLSIHARPSFPTDPVLFRLSRLAYPTFHLSGHISRDRKGWTREEESHELTANPQKISKIGF